jgi:hypothetical protein
MDLSPEEQAFFDEGDALSGPAPVGAAVVHRRRSRRHSRHAFVDRLRSRRWRRAWLASLLVVATVAVGYWVSMLVVGQDLPKASDLGVDTRGR